MTKVTVEASASVTRAMMSTPSHRRRRMSRYSPSSTACSPESAVASELDSQAWLEPTYDVMLTARDVIAKTQAVVPSRPQLSQDGLQVAV